MLGANVRRLRESMEPKMSQEQLALVCGLSRQTIAAVELGKYKSSDQLTVESLAKGLGVSAEDLRRPHLGVVSKSAVVRTLMRSKWAPVLKVRPGEKSWLALLPRILFSGSKPDPDHVAKLLMWYRETCLEENEKKKGE